MFALFKKNSFEANSDVLASNNGFNSTACIIWKLYRLTDFVYIFGFFLFRAEKAEYIFPPAFNPDQAEVFVRLCGAVQSIQQTQK